MTEDVQPSAFAQRDIPEIPADEPPAGCELAIDADGACSMACNTAAVIDQFVPEGTCAMFACELSNGETLQIGGCNL